MTQLLQYTSKILGHQLGLKWHLFGYAFLFIYGLYLHHYFWVSAGTLVMIKKSNIVTSKSEFLYHYCFFNIHACPTLILFKIQPMGDLDSDTKVVL